MQQKIILDTNIYIDIFNKGLHGNLYNPFRYILFLAYPVLHELWMGTKGKREIKYLTAFQNEFIKLRRLVIPSVTTLVLIGKACHQLRSSGKVNPAHPKHYNDVAIAASARQIGATVITHNTRDFKVIQSAIDFDMEKP
jgi:predicted nucleic acid-binding protein